MLTHHNFIKTGCLGLFVLHSCVIHRNNCFQSAIVPRLVWLSRSSQGVYEGRQACEQIGQWRAWDFSIGEFTLTLSLGFKAQEGTLMRAHRNAHFAFCLRFQHRLAQDWCLGHSLPCPSHPGLHSFFGDASPSLALQPPSCCFPLWALTL